MVVWIEQEGRNAKGKEKITKRKVNILTNRIPVMYATLRSCPRRLDLYRRKEKERKNKSRVVFHFPGVFLPNACIPKGRLLVNDSL